MENKASKQPTPLWDLKVGELSGHNIEQKGRSEVNAKLKQGWVLLHIYTLKYKENGIWRQRPMAILGKPRPGRKVENKEKQG